MELSTDRARLRVNIDSQLDAAQVSALILELARKRSEMMPPVPATKRHALETNVEVTMIEGHSLTLATLVSGGARAWLRHSGLGWMTFELTRGHLEWLADFVSGKVSRPNRPQ